MEVYKAAENIYWTFSSQHKQSLHLLVLYRGLLF